MEMNEFVVAECDLEYESVDASATTCHCISYCSCDCDDGTW